MRYALLLCSLTPFVLPATTSAEDHFLTIGGGYSRSGNQVSIERNVAFLQSALIELPGYTRQHDLFFADGAGRRPDVCYRDPAATQPYTTAPFLLARIFSDNDSYGTRYRNHRLSGVRGASSPTLVRQRLKELARSLSPEDRLVLYATAHGGKAKKQKEDDKDKEEPAPDQEPEEFNEFNTKLYFWNRKSALASEFEEMLDQLPETTPVVLVMVQCYSGGFSHLIFNGADPTKGLSPHARCGFFSQVHTLPAAGCTTDVEEEDYQEYSSFFWAALAGRTRTGRPVKNADYDGNSLISFAEAHAYAVLNSDTIDIPVRTTGALLRAVHKLSDNPAPKASGRLAQFSKDARPDQWAVVAGLASKLGLSTDSTVQDVTRRQYRFRRNESSARRELSQAAREVLRRKRALRERVQEEWDEIEDGRNEFAKELILERPDEFVETVEALSEYEAYLCAEDLRQQKEALADEAENQQAKARRLLLTCENIVQAKHLPNIASTETVERFERIRFMEEGYLQ